METVLVDWQPFGVFTLIEYTPADKAVAVAELIPDGDHVYEYGEVPPVTTTCAEPSDNPLQDTLWVVVDKPKDGLEEMETVVADKQPFDDFTFTL